MMLSWDDDVGRWYRGCMAGGRVVGGTLVGGSLCRRRQSGGRCYSKTSIKQSALVAVRQTRHATK